MTIGRTESPSISEAVLRKGLQDHYHLQVRSIVRMRSVVGIICADDCQMIWKSSNPHATPHRLMAVRRVAERLQQEGIACAAPIPNRNGWLISVFEDGTSGHLQPWLKGRHVNLVNPQERVSALATIAYLHRLSAQVPLLDLEGLVRLPLLAKLHVKMSHLEQTWADVRRDIPALAPLEEPLFHVLTDIRKTLQARQSLYPMNAASAYCHRDLAPHNMLWSNRLPVALIDFDMAGFDDPFADIIQWSNHTLFLGGGEPGHFQTCMNVYARICPMSDERKKDLAQFLRFPDMLVRAIGEWAKADEPALHRNRVLAAGQKELLRWSLWSQAFEE